MYRLLIFIGLCFFFTPLKASHTALNIKPILSLAQDSIDVPIYPLTLTEEEAIRKGLSKAQKNANTVIWLIPLGLIMFGLGGLIRTVLAIKNLISILKIEKQVAHYPEDDELRMEVDSVKQKVLTSFFIMLGWNLLLILIFILLLSLIIGGGGELSILIGLGAFIGALSLLLLESFVFKTNKIE